MNGTPHTWISDIREGLKEINKDFFHYYNDNSDNQRRIKFYTPHGQTLNISELFELQAFIEKRRPYLNVSVKDWSNRSGNGPWSYSGPTYCVYYKPKVEVA